jgi:hypothetical protein
MSTQASPYPSQIHVLTERSEQLLRDVQEIKELVKEQNSRVKKLELWQAGMKGATQTLKVAWLIGGGIAGALLLDLIRSM